MPMLTRGLCAGSSCAHKLPASRPNVSAATSTRTIAMAPPREPCGSGEWCFPQTGRGVSVHGPQAGRARPAGEATAMSGRTGAGRGSAAERS